MSNKSHLNRRKFLRLAGAGLAGAGAGLLLPVYSDALAAGLAAKPAKHRPGSSQLTAGAVIERIQQQVGVPWKSPTVDTFKAGNGSMPITGITTTFMATLDVIQRSAAAGRNMVITHEPTFWNNLDLSEGLTNDPLYIHKMDFIHKNNMVVWRFHDHWHARKPDGIMEGQLKTLGWDRYKNLDIGGIRNGVFELPRAITLKGFAQDVKTRLQSDNIRVIGQPGMMVSRICNAANHLRGSVEALSLADAFIIKEADRENDLGEWCRDIVRSGQEKGFVFISHNRGEEFGMDNCATWLRNFVPEAPIRFVPSGDPFWRTLT